MIALYPIKSYIATPVMWIKHFRQKNLHSQTTQVIDRKTLICYFGHHIRQSIPATPTRPHHWNQKALLYLMCSNKQVKSDLHLWLVFLQHYNGRTIISPSTITHSSALQFCSDASKIAFGATYGSHWIQGTWPTTWLKCCVIDH